MRWMKEVRLNPKSGLAKESFLGYEVNEKKWDFNQNLALQESFLGYEVTERSEI